MDCRKLGIAKYLPRYASPKPNSCLITNNAYLAMII